ncbi:MAG: DUF2891 domain-containing protein [Acidobacteriota bacterium]
MLTPDMAARMARVALGHVTREWPNKMDHVLTGPADVRGPRDLHPIFFGSFDWHSSVHGHWLLARLYRRFPGMPEASAIRALLDAQFTADKVAGEVAYLARPSARAFERPYGWAWALMLASELARHHSTEGQQWHSALQPLADAFVARFHEFLPLAVYPVRAGLHPNTAFALLLALEYADAAGDAALASLCAGKARGWYAADAAMQVLEPSLSDFLSPVLVEAACLAAVMGRDEFAAWFARYLPNAGGGTPEVLFTPATVPDRTDGHIAHLDGLNLSRAWCWRRIVDRLPADAPLVPRVEATIDRHLASAIDRIAGDYAGEHWLASFAALALDPYAA